jgi:hypothetical protein
MLKEVLDQSLAALKTIDSFADNPDKKVFRGEVGKINIIANTGCIIMPEFKPPASLGMTDDVRQKELHFSPNFFVISAKHKTLEEAEDECMELAVKVVRKIHATELFVDMEGSSKFCYLELTDNEWLERSASLCVIALEFTVKLQV